MAFKSMTDIAYEILSGKKRAIQFQKLWEEVAKKTGVPVNKAAQFYSELTLDSRFAPLKDSKWDLTERRKYNESHVDLSKIELGEDEPEEIEIEEPEIIKEEDRY